MARRAVHDPAAAPADRQGTREPAVPGGNGMRRRTGRGRARRLVCQQRVLGPGHRRHLYLADELDADVAGPAGVPPEVAAGRVVSRSDYFRVSWRWLYHWAKNRRNDFRGRRFFLARADARDPLLRPEFDRPALSFDHSHRADDA